MKQRQLYTPILLLFAILVPLQSCKVGAPALSRSAAMPDTFYSGQADSAGVARLQWGVFYRDSLLTGYIGKALATNWDLRIAREDVNLAAARLSAIRKNFLPAISAGAATSVEKFGDYTMDGVGNDDTNLSENLPPAKRIPRPYTEWISAITFDWEADIWGRLASERKAGLASLAASAEVANLVTTTLVSEVATAYFDLIGLDQEKNVLEENLRLQQVGLELMHVQKAGGRVNQLAIDQFEAQLLNTRAQLAAVEQRILEAEAELSGLIGEYPRALTRTVISEYDSLPAMSPGLPHELVANRPDIRRAEHELAAADANVQMARAAFYPVLSLSGHAGISAFDLSQWFLLPESAVYRLAAGLSAPVFQRGRIRAMHAAANTKQKIALYQYEKAIRNAFSEVYSSYNALLNLSRQTVLKRQELQVLFRAFNNANTLFSGGYATYLEVITAQRRMLEAEIELVRLKRDRLKAMALVYRAAGGGWRAEE